MATKRGYQFTTATTAEAVQGQYIITDSEGGGTKIIPVDYFQQKPISTNIATEDNLNGDYFFVSDGADGVKRTYANTIKGIRVGTNLIDKNKVESGGYYNYLNGLFVSNNNFCESDFIPCVEGDKFYTYIPSNNSVKWDQDSICLYDENKNYVSGIYPINQTFITIPSGVRFFRIPLSYPIGTSYRCVSRCPINSFTDTNDGEIGKIARSKILDKIGFSKDLAASQNLVSQLAGNVNLFDFGSIELGGFYNWSNGRKISSGSFANDYAESDFIECTKNTILYRYSPYDGTRNWKETSICFYDSNKNFVVGVMPTTDGKLEIPDNDNIAYMRFPVYLPNNSASSYFVVSNIVVDKFYPYTSGRVLHVSDVKGTIGNTDFPISQKAVKKVNDDLTSLIESAGVAGSQWYGKTWYSYGTSITDVDVGTGKYVPYLVQMSGMVNTNRGIGGGGIGNLGGYSQGQVYDRICTLADGKANADLITLETGANDTDIDESKFGSIYDSGRSTLCGCLNDCLQYLLANTSAQIVVMPSPTYKDSDSTKWQKYMSWAETIRKICDVNRVYFINPSCGLGLARYNATGNKYVVDQIHQSNLGGYILAKHMWMNLKNIPIFTNTLPST